MVRAAAKLQAVVLVGVLTGGLLLVAAPASAGGGLCHDPEPTSASSVAVDAKDNCFFPTVLYVEEGATVTWTNRDFVPHSVTGLALGWGTGQKTLFRGDSVSVEFSDPGVYPYTCILHPGMVGAVVVGEPSAKDAGAAATNLGAHSGGSSGASGPAAEEAAPASSVTARGQLPWLWALGAMLVLAAVLFLVFDLVRGRRLRSVA
jgi:plastocyanin